MMMSERPAPPPEEKTSEAPAATHPEGPPAPKPTHGVLKQSPFLMGFDAMLAIIVVALAFAIASFAVKNSDFWLHLGTGRLIAQGQYEFGKAPFTYSAAERPWVNHSWLYDFLTFELFEKGGGAAVVIFKGIVLALLGALLLLIRKPGQSLWLGVVLVALAFLASAPWLFMRPAIMSCFFLGVTLYILIQCSTKESSRRLYVGLGVTFCLWSNFDEWFILGPIVTALFLLGTILQQKLTKRLEGDDRLPIASLATALGIGIAACMVNPHHVGVWALPQDLIGRFTSPLIKEKEFAARFAMGIDPGRFDFDNSTGGNPVNAFAAAILLALNILGFAVNARRLSWSLLFPNAGLLALAIVHARAVPFYAFAAAPITALNLGSAITRLREKPLRVGTLQLLAALRVGIRMFLLLGGLAALAASYPGWLHPFGDPRRLAWGVEPNESFQQAATILQHWRDEGKIPPGARGLILDLDLANYCAWFAPKEKTFFDDRVGLHAPEAEAFAKIRRAFFLPERRSDIDVKGFLREQKITYSVLSIPNSSFNQTAFTSLLVNPAWELWTITGRVSVFGWRPQQTISPAEFAALRFDPVRLAFGPEVQLLPDPGPLNPPLPRDLLEKYLTPSPPLPEAAEESSLLDRYGSLMAARNEECNRIVRRAANFAPIDIVNRVLSPIPAQPPETFAAAVLAVRAARRAILNSPNHPDGYLALARIYERPFYFVPSDFMRLTVVVTSLERYLARLEANAVPTDPASLIEQLEKLRDLHFQGGPPRDWQAAQNRQPPEPRHELALDAMRRTLNVLKISAGKLNQDAVNAKVQELEKAIPNFEKKIHNFEDLWLNNSARLPTQYDKARGALQYGLTVKAFEEIKKFLASETEVAKVRPEVLFEAYIDWGWLQMITGRPEAAEEVEMRVAELQKRPGMRLDRLLDLQTQLALVLGRFSELIQLQSKIEAQRARVVDLTRTTEVPKAVALLVARNLAFPNCGALEEYGFLKFDENARAKLVGEPFEQPFYADLFLLRYQKILSGLEESNLALAMTYLEQGDNRSAITRFRQITDSGPILYSFQGRQTAEFYLKLLNQR
jgi:hypothetical protein